MSSGGNMLSGLMGGGVVDGIANTIAKFTGINVTIVKTTGRLEAYATYVWLTSNGAIDEHACNNKACQQ